MKSLGLLALVLVASTTATTSVALATPPATTATGRTVQAAPTDLGCSEDLVERELANGASWRMCARIHPMKGLVLEQIEFKPPTDREYAGYKRVLDQLWLAQLNVPYDNGLVQYDDITSFGFGGDHLIPQTDVTCPGNALEVAQTKLLEGILVTRAVPGICVQEVPTGLATHSLEAIGTKEFRIAEQGSALEVSSLAKISWYEYQQKITFDDHGEIDVALGATGDVAPGGVGGAMFGTDPAYGWQLGGQRTEQGEPTHAASHWHNAIWRVDFGIDRGERQYVEQWDYDNVAEPGAVPKLTGTSVRKQRAFHAVPGKTMDDDTWFRVLNPDSLNADGHPRSYEIVNRNLPHREIDVFAPLMSFANVHPCQEYASMNLHAGCPGESVLDYVADAEGELDDPVAWVNVGFHHIDRDEDQSPMHMHWQRFQLVPRDFFAQKPTIADDRACINGAGWIDSLDSPCVATNLAAPTVTAVGDEVSVGTTLHATPGRWNERRTSWEYSYLWLRDGQPITGGDDAHPLGRDYVVTAADQGARLSVRVTASHPGFPSGHADSDPLQVPPSNLWPTGSPTRTAIKKVKVQESRNGKANGRARLRISVTAENATPTGNVTIRVKQGKRVVFKSVQRLRRGTTATTVRRLHAGRYTIVARYPGDAAARKSKAKTALRVR